MRRLLQHLLLAAIGRRGEDIREVSTVLCDFCFIFVLFLFCFCAIFVLYLW